jgi:hypothetical protein
MSQITPAQVLTALSHHIGKANGIHMGPLVMRITGLAQPNERVQRRVRQVVAELRMQGKRICAHPASGYFMAEIEGELNDTCEFLYERAMTSLVQISRMKKISLPDLRGQLHLPI